MQLGQDARTLAEQIAAAADVAVFTDYRDAQLPGVMLMPDRLVFDRLDGTTATVTWRLVIFGSGAGAADALDDAGAVLARLNAALGLGDEIEASTVSNPNLSGDPLPVLVATLTTEHEE
ncbi:hypothetical protein PZ938_07650 [Luteipulveratus sp. YIM 133132]|uniref:hypothetical protein n=1 Tax=Luteipulveratus flavus TaxID=3031728 RepID=UPI0023AF3570|nr:hypothetical protein [Luteipulveratus sp. YIM 133132]MDE9365476.1 hypothetical protein [Luteipulveratus sp. YIM 133132]